MENNLGKEVHIFSDGACSGNPGPGGWGAILRCGDREMEISGGAADTTNNRMELLGVISALEQLKYPCRVMVTTDSKYVADGLMKGWARSWRRNNWIKSDKKPALNSDLWERLLNLADKHEISVNWIKGHAGHAENERCDVLAVQKRDEFR